MTAEDHKNDELASGECWLDVVALFAGLEIENRIELGANVALEKILDANLIANVARIAKEVILGLPSDENALLHPVYGMRYRVRGKALLGTDEAKFNSEQIAKPQKAFVRAVGLLRGQELVTAGSFVYETGGLGQRRLQSYQFNTATLSVHYEAAYFGDAHADELVRVYRTLLDPYLEGNGTSVAVAIDRLGTAGTRTNEVDRNLDLCIAAEIVFLFGMKSENEMITENVRENARVFFGDEEFFWDRDTVAQVVYDSYKERSHTVHGRRGNGGRGDVLIGLNARLREILKAALGIYIERRPAKLLARQTWTTRRASLEAGLPLEPIFSRAPPS